MIEQIASKDEVRSAIAEARREGKTVGLVPTMGALHEGHLSLVRAACARTDLVVVSIFVNPTQFGPGEDFERYPRQIEADLNLLDSEGVEIAFTPSVQGMYGDGPQVTVDPGPLANRWEGEVRPGHFDGMATVVAKLFNIVRPDLAFFGEKDYQQLAVIRAMVKDLAFGLEVAGMPIVREPDGLALSSRNAYLSPAERTRALALSADTRLFLWTISWDVHALLHHPLSLFDANIFHPERLTLTYSDPVIEAQERKADLLLLVLIGGALAVIGHVERAWGYSFVMPSGDPDCQAFVTVLRKLMNGEPVGLATMIGASVGNGAGVGSSGVAVGGSGVSVGGMVAVGRMVGGKVAVAGRSVGGSVPVGSGVAVGADVTVGGSVRVARGGGVVSIKTCATSALAVAG